jgi:hypothetical protein
MPEKGVEVVRALPQTEVAHVADMAESFAEYAIAHEAGHAVVGRFVKISAPVEMSFFLRRGSDGRLYLGDFATSFPFPPDDQIPGLPEAVKNCICYTLAAGLAATQFSGLSLPNENTGLDSDRNRLSKLTTRSLDSFVPSALTVIKQERRAYQEVVSQCMRKYKQLKTQRINEGNHTLLGTAELEAIFDRTMLATTEHTARFQDTMSAHEAGHATLGITLGARIEAVYAIRGSKLPNGNYSIHYLTRFGALGRAGLDLKDRILMTAGAAAGEILLNGSSDEDCVKADRADLENLGVWNFEYCVQHATQLLRENEALLTAVRDRIRTSMSNLRQCKVTRGGTHIILVKGREIEKLFRTLGFRVTSSTLDLEIARLGAASR